MAGTGRQRGGATIDTRMDGTPDDPLPVTSEGVRGRVRTVTGVPWRRLFGYLRPEAGRFTLALVGLVFGSGLALLVPLVVAGLVTEVVSGGDAAGLDRLVIGLVALFLAQSRWRASSRATCWA